MSELSACQACGAVLVWAAHSQTGKMAPITAEPVEGGNILAWTTWPPGSRPRAQYTILSTPELRAWAVERNVPLRLNHFANCPEAERFQSQPKENT